MIFCGQLQRAVFSHVHFFILALYWFRLRLQPPRIELAVGTHLAVLDTHAMVLDLCNRISFPPLPCFRHDELIKEIIGLAENLTLGVLMVVTELARHLFYWMSSTMIT